MLFLKYESTYTDIFFTQHAMIIKYDLAEISNYIEVK